MASAVPQAVEEKLGLYLSFQQPVYPLRFDSDSAVEPSEIELCERIRVRCAMNVMMRYLGLGAVAFWGPDILLHAMKSHEFSSRDAHALTFLLPCSLLLVYSLTLWLERKTGRLSVALGMLFGFWVFGPLSLMISGLAGGGRFSTLTEWLSAFSFAALATFAFPIYTYIMSVYDGSTYALAWASILVIAMHFVLERHHHVWPENFRFARDTAEQQ